MEAVATVICGTILALGQAWINYRLKQQDNARDAARAEQKQKAEEIKAEAAARAAEVKAEALSAAKAVEEKVHAAQESTDLQLGEIHVLVNTRLTEAIARVQALEEKLGLHSGQEIPGPPTITEKTDGPDETEPPSPPRRSRKAKA